VTPGLSARELLHESAASPIVVDRDDPVRSSTSLVPERFDVSNLFVVILRNAS